IDCSENVILSRSLTGGRPSVIRENAATTPTQARNATIARPAQIARAIQPAADGVVRGRAARAVGAGRGVSYKRELPGGDWLAEGCHRPARSCRRERGIDPYDAVTTSAVALHASSAARTRSATAGSVAPDGASPSRAINAAPATGGAASRTTRAAGIAATIRARSRSWKAASWVRNTLPPS